MARSKKMKATGPSPRRPPEKNPREEVLLDSDSTNSDVEMYDVSAIGPPSLIDNDRKNNPFPYKEICMSLMSPQPDYKTENGKQKVKGYTCTCPFKGCTVYKPNERPWTNLHSHMVTCAGGVRANGKKLVHLEFVKRQEETAPEAMKIDNYFSCTPEKYKSVMRKLQFIILKDAPIYWVVDPAFRKLCNDTDATKVGVKSFKAILLALSDLVTQELKVEMKDACFGVINHDSWTKSSFHYLGIIAHYNIKQWHYSRGDKYYKSIPVHSLVSVSPIAKYPEDDSGVVEEATLFNAESLATQITKVFKDNYDIDVLTWLKAIVADNAEVNKSVARRLKKPHIGCRNHLLNLDAKDSINGVPSLGKVFDDIQNVSCFIILLYL
jgi:hypothetical protein